MLIFASPLPLKQNKAEREKDEKYSPKTFKLRRSSKPPFHASISPEMASKQDSSEAKASESPPNKSLEMASIFNGLQGSVNRLFHSLSECVFSFKI